MTKAEIYKLFGEKDGNKLYKLLNSKCNNFCTFWKKTGNSGTNPANNFIGTTDAQDIVFKANNIERLKIFNNSTLNLPTIRLTDTNNGKGLALATTAADYLRLFFAGDSYFNGLIGSIYYNSKVDHIFGTGASSYTTKAVIKQNGNVLIGTTVDAGFRLDVVGTSRIRSAASGLDSNLLIESTTNEKFALLSLKSGSGSTWALGACNYQFSNAFIIRSGATGTERFAIFPTTGNVSIGTTVDAGFRLDVNGTFRSSSDATINTLTVGRGTGNVATNTAIGFQALRINTTGSSNTSIGYQSMFTNTVGSSNTAIGMYSLTFANSSNNTAVGNNAGNSLTSGGDNTYLGHNSFLLNTTGSNNAGLGRNSGYFLTGSNNTIIGASAGSNSSFTSGSNNTIIGANVTPNSNVSNRVIIGDGQGNQRIQIFSSGNTSIGFANNATDLGFKLDVNGTARIQEKLSVGTPTEVSAVLEVSSNTQGFLPPRMTTIQRDAIVSPATGLVLFNTTTDTLQVRASTGWINL
jgi:hypothetical protein